MDRNLDRRVEALVRVTRPGRPRGRARRRCSSWPGATTSTTGRSARTALDPDAAPGRAWSTCRALLGGAGPGPDACRGLTGAGSAGRGRGRRPLARRPRQPRGRAGAPAALRRLVAAQGQARRPASTRCSARCARSRRRPAARPGPGRRLGSLRYPVPEGRKRVRYWACEATGGGFEVNREVDEIWWAPLGRGADPARPGPRRPGARAVRGRHPAHPRDRGRAARVGRGQAGLGRRRRRPPTGPEGGSRSRSRSVHSSRRTAWGGPAAPTCAAAARPWTRSPGPPGSTSRSSRPRRPRRSTTTRRRGPARSWTW